MLVLNVNDRLEVRPFVVHDPETDLVKVIPRCNRAPLHTGRRNDMMKYTSTCSIESANAGVEVGDEGVKRLRIKAVGCQACAHQRRLAVEVTSVDVGAGGDESFDGRMSSSARGYMQRGVTLFIQHEVDIHCEGRYVGRDLANHVNQCLRVIS